MNMDELFKNTITGEGKKEKTPSRAVTETIQVEGGAVSFDHSQDSLTEALGVSDSAMKRLWERSVKGKERQCYSEDIATILADKDSSFVEKFALCQLLQRRRSMIIGAKEVAQKLFKTLKKTVDNM